MRTEAALSSSLSSRSPHLLLPYCFPSLSPILPRNLLLTLIFPLPTLLHLLLLWFSLLPPP